MLPVTWMTGIAGVLWLTIRRILQCVACRSGSIGKCRTLRVSNRVTVRRAVTAMARSALSIVWWLASHRRPSVLSDVGVNQMPYEGREPERS